MDRNELWKRYRQYLCKCSKLGLSIDVSRMSFKTSDLESMEPAMQHAYEAMAGLEAGQIANPDEQRMVGHYWLRHARMAPNLEITEQIESTRQKIVDFARKVHAGQIKPTSAARFTNVLLVGIGGSGLGPQLVADALGGNGGASGRRDKMRMHFFDNTDPDGFNRVIATLGVRLKSTLVLVISKSGGTKETRNGMLTAQRAFERMDLNFADHAVAVTGDGSALDQHAREQGWLERFAMWDWVGGRTSLMSAVGLVPAALQGLDIDAMLDGAAEMDELTRCRQTLKNPAALLALMWHLVTNGRGEKDMVIVPYKDRLLMMSRYLQQLVMESLGKQFDVDGEEVNQGIAVYGNKGSTDQHAYVQQLRDGVNNFFATFIVCLQDTRRLGARAKGEPPRSIGEVEVEPDITSGDYLSGFWQGTREALYENGRSSITITLNKIDARTVGALIALYERAVGFYGTLVHINAYHQPGVEAGKKAATAVLEIQTKLLAHLRANPDATYDAEALADALGAPDRVETVHHILEHLAANKRHVHRARRLYRVA